MSTITKSQSKKLEKFEKILSSERDQLRVRISGRLDEVYVDREPDDEAALASDSATKDITVATLERERRTLEEVESALQRIQKGSYGLCAFCGEPIPDARLQALPSARLCITCAGKASSNSAAAAD
jgi:DnaK suppressor protein